MQSFMQSWASAALTSLGFFWTALWAFALGYLISSLIQVLVTRERMQQAMGGEGAGAVGLGTFFGFISSSCSFAALATTRSLFKKGAGFVPAMAFLLSSTNLVIELGIVIAIFLGWQFVVGEYLGGLLLILGAWLFVRITRPARLIKKTRERLEEDDEHSESQGTDWKEKVTSLKGWQEIGTQYVMEWQMIWKDVLVGFTVAGIISAFVPDAFFATLFVGSAEGGNASFGEVLAQAVVGPVAAFFTFIGSMGNIPLAALLFDHGVSFAGVMAFIFSDLVVLPVLRINAQYYGWPMALYILLMLFVCLVVTAVLMHYGFAALNMLPDGSETRLVSDRDMFSLNYGFWLNLLFLVVSAGLIVLWRKQRQAHSGHHHHHHHGGGNSLAQRILPALAKIAMVWLAVGVVIHFAL